MKKSLVALAALAATSAFAQFSIDGGLDAGLQSIDYKGNKVTGIAGNGSSTSQINFRGTSDLGGGLKANFRVETDWNTASNSANTGANNTPVGADTKLANGSTFGNGEIRVGLAGAFGTVNLGAVNQNGLNAILVGQPFGTAIGGGYGSVLRVNAAASAVREDNTIAYVSPAFNGFTVSALKSYKQTKAVDSSAVTQSSFSTALGAYDKQGVQEFGLAYVNGPIAANYNTAKFDNTGVGAGSTANTVNTLGVNYTMGAAKLFLLNQTNKITTGTVTTDTKYTAVSATYAMGSTTLMAQSGSLEQSAGASAGKKSSLIGLGADYALSKTTNLYFRNESINDEAGVIAAAATIDGSNTKRTRQAFGLRTAF